MDLVSYLRVSSESQVDGFGLPVQRRAVQRWAKSNGHRVVEEIVDAGVSGTRDAADRPGLSLALDMLRPPPRARGLIVARLDRLARSLTVQEAVLAVVWKAGGEVFTADGGLVDQDDADDPMRTAIRQVQGVFAQLERSLVAKRMKDGRRLKAEQGAHAVGQHPFGQRSGGPGRDGVVHDDERVVVQRIVQLRKQGASYRAVCAALDAEGLRPRRAESWQPAVVRRIAERAVKQ
jgi:DNA invertase Pin-like site-specific DNA recombinase